MGPGNDATALKQIREELNRIKDDLKETNVDLLAISKAAREAQGNFSKIAIPKDLENGLQVNEQLLEQIVANSKERQRLEKALQSSIAKRAQAESEVNKEIIKNRVETQLINKALRDEAALSSTLVGAYKKLEIRYNAARKKVRDLNSANKKNTAEYRRARKELRLYESRIKRADRAVGDFRKNVGNYGTAFGKATLALRSFAATFGLISAAQIAREIFEQVKAIDGLNKALTQVTETAEGFTQANDFLRDTAEESGAEVLSLTKAYVKFFAAAKTTTLTLEETQDIFRSVAKAAGVLGLSVDDTNGALRALEQILSKGKVQAEEIRGQLGERLPGAFQILAKSMGVTTEQLDKLLRDGKVLADDVLPGFARELNKAFSLDTIDRVETLAAAQNRLSNAWTLFVTNLEGSEGRISKVFTGIFESLTKTVEFLDDLNKTDADKLAESLKELEKAGAEDVIFKLKETIVGTNKTMKDAARDGFFKYRTAVDGAAATLLGLEEKLKQANKAVEEGGARGEGYIAVVASLKEQILEAQKSLAIKKGRLDGINKILRPVTRETKNYNEELKKTSKALKRIKENKADANFLGTTVEEAKKRAEEAKKIADQLNGTDLGGGNEVNLFDIEVPDVDEINGALEKIVEKYKQVGEAAAISAEDQRAVFGQLFSTFSSYYGIDLNAFQNLLFDKTNAAEDYANAAKSVTNAIFEGQLIKYDNEIAANQDRLDTILNDDTASEETKKQARIEAERNEKQIRLKQAKAERRNTIIQIGIDTAAAVAKALGQTGVLSPLFIPGLIATGVAQAAFVAAQPLPRFEKGTENAPEGYAWTNEKGAEMITDKFGKVKSFGTNDGPTMQYLEAGDKVFTAERTKQILNSNEVSQQEALDMAIFRMSFNAMAGIKSEIKEGIQEGFKGVKIISNTKVINKVPNDGYWA